MHNSQLETLSPPESLKGKYNMSLKIPIQLLVLGGIAVWFSGCVAPKVIVWDPDSNDSIRHFQQPVLPENDQNFALTELDRGELFHNYGDRQHSDTRLRNALRVMDQITSDSNTTAATLLSEDYRTYRGQPYERATAYFYRGLCHYELGHYEQALAAFKSALAKDQETLNDDQKTRMDYLAGYFMQAQCLSALGEHQEAEAVLASARVIFPQHPLLAVDRPKGNLIVVAGVGQGPWKMQGAFWTVKFMAGQVPEGEYSLSANTKSAGTLYEATDLLVQADSNKAGGATGAAIGRGIAKESVNLVFSALIGRDAGIHEKRDLRAWSGMPRKLYIGSFDLPPGLHTLTFTISDNDNKASDAHRYQQTWHDVPVKAGEIPQLLFVRLMPNGQNFHDLVSVALEEALAAKKQQETK